jgi:hypothetical protein
MIRGIVVNLSFSVHISYINGAQQQILRNFGNFLGFFANLVNLEEVRSLERAPGDFSRQGASTNGARGGSKRRRKGGPVGLVWIGPVFGLFRVLTVPSTMSVGPAD